MSYDEASRGSDSSADNGAMRSLFAGGGGGSDSDDEGSLVRLEEVGGVVFALRCADNDGSAPGALFAYTVWSGSVQVRVGAQISVHAVLSRPCDPNPNACVASLPGG